MLAVIGEKPQFCLGSVDLCQTFLIKIRAL
jgi:hypothetical protein